MTKRFAALLAIGVFLCLTFASLLLADEAAAPLSITGHDPSANEVGVPLIPNIQATFDDDVNVATIGNNTFVVHGHLGGLAPGSFTYNSDRRKLTLDPTRSFHAGEVVRVSATSRISSTGGTALTPYGWQFTVGPVRTRRFAGFIDSSAALLGVQWGDVAWGDYDNDGDLDILLAGHDGISPISRVYRNDGPISGFTDISAAIRAGESVAWGDYDNDGDLDILLAGHTGTAYASEVYRNDGGGTFTGITAGLLGVTRSCVAWGDVDNDGDLDILLAGYAGGVVFASAVYRNDGALGFSDIGAGLTGLSDASAAWGDYDNDGDLDILLMGQDIGYWRSTIVYRNDGGGAFTDIGAGLLGMAYGSCSWADYDNDGDLDILLTGEEQGGWPATELYRNDGASGFTLVSPGLPDLADSCAAWGDYDSDGDLDVVLAGRDAVSLPATFVYRNDGGGAFTDIGAGLADVEDGAVAWGDVDGDGDLDILLTGEQFSGKLTAKVYRNNSVPTLGTVTPDSGSGPVNVTTYFDTSWKDTDDWGDLKQCYFHIGDSPTLAGNVTLLYNSVKRKLWLLDDSGTAWLGGCTPGHAVYFSNSQAALDCLNTTVHHSGETLTVRWAIEFKPGFEGAKRLGLKCKDRGKAKAKGKWKGTWTVTP
jgi:hypothetical protein